MNRSSDESGQTTTEYILVLMISVGLAMLVLRDLVAPVVQKTSDYISRFVEETLFKKANFHQLKR